MVRACVRVCACVRVGACSCCRCCGSGDAWWWRGDEGGGEGGGRLPSFPPRKRVTAHERQATAHETAGHGLRVAIGARSVGPADSAPTPRRSAAAGTSAPVSGVGRERRGAGPRLEPARDFGRLGRWVAVAARPACAYVTAHETIGCGSRRRAAAERWRPAMPRDSDAAWPARDSARIRCDSDITPLEDSRLGETMTRILPVPDIARLGGVGNR